MIRRLSLLVLVSLCAVTSLQAIIQREQEKPAPQGPIPDLRPPRPALPPVAPEEKTRHLYWGLGGGLVIVAVLAGLLAARKHVPAAIQPPYETARGELQKARDAESIAEILRSYCVNAFPLPGPGQTWQDIAHFFSGHERWTPELAARWAALGDPVEQVKFSPARVEIPAAQAEALHLLTILEDIRRPKPAPIP